MSKFFNKKMNKTPVRSPSPDIANRSIITRTPSPINEVMNKLRISHSSRSPLGKGFTSHQQCEAQIHSLQEKNKILVHQHKIMQIQNIRLNKQVEYLKEFNLKQRNQSHNKNNSQIKLQPDYLNEYEIKLGQMSDEIKRIHDLLIMEKKKNQRIQSQNISLRINGQNQMKGSITPNIKKQLNQIQYQITSNFDKLMFETKLNLQRLIQQQRKKIERMQSHQQIILKLLNKNNQQTPTHNNKYYTNPSTTYQTPQDIDFTGKYYRQRLFHDVQCQKCKIYLKKIAQLQAQIDIKNIERQSSIKKPKISNFQGISPSHLEDYLQKLEEIRLILSNQKVEESINHIEESLNDIYQINERFDYIKQQKNKRIEELEEKDQKQIQQILALKGQIGELKKQIQNLQIQNQRFRHEIEKLNNVIQNSPKKRQKSTLFENKKPNESNFLRKYIEQAIQRIVNLQGQIQNTLKQ